MAHTKPGINMEKNITTSSRASLSRAGCLLLSPSTPSSSVMPLINSSCVTECLELREIMGFDALITS